MLSQEPHVADAGSGARRRPQVKLCMWRCRASWRRRKEMITHAPIRACRLPLSCGTKMLCFMLPQHSVVGNHTYLCCSCGCSSGDLANPKRLFHSSWCGMDPRGIWATALLMSLWTIRWRVLLEPVADAADGQQKRRPGLRPGALSPLSRGSRTAAPTPRGPAAHSAARGNACRMAPHFACLQQSLWRR